MYKQTRSTMTTAAVRAMFGTLFSASLVPLLAESARGDTPAANADAAKLHTLFDQEWQWTLREYPEFATGVGDNRYNDKLTDLSSPAMDRRKAHERDYLRQLREIDRGRLTGQDVVSYDLSLAGAQQDVALHRYPAGKIPSGGEFLPYYEWTPLSQMAGVHLDIPALPRLVPLRNTKDYDDFLARLRAVPTLVDQVIVLMKRGIAGGWMPPAVPIRKVLPQIEQQWVSDVTLSPLYKPFESFPETIPAVDRSRLTALAREAIVNAVIPALKELHKFISTTYLPACRHEIAASSLPGGAEYYQAQIRWLTTTELSAREIHEIGEREVARIRAAMGEVIKQAGFAGTFAEFVNLLRTDPRYARVPTNDVLPGFRDIAKRVDPELPKLSAELPRTPYGIREIPDYRGETAAFYTPGAADGTRAGYFNANTFGVSTKPRHEMEALFLHEGVPGHHLQVARAQELKDLPDFRRNGLYNAYVEGWALYAESLGEELGLYKDPYSKFGRLNGEIHRACRLVVDTGMHALEWTRDRAIAYMKANTSLSETFIVAEIDRYIVWPGQALGYKLGELKIKAVRARASKALGPKFDIRKFHNALIDDGPLPLDLLERRIDAWIETQR
jgi:uncharacterized protein (DUF885 family)